MGKERVQGIIESVLEKKKFILKKLHNPIKDEVFEFDFSTCEGSIEEAILALVSVEKIFRLYQDKTATDFDHVIVDRQVDAFLNKHFLQYPAYCLHRAPHPEYKEYLYYTNIRQDEQYDDLTILAIKKKFDAWQPAGHTGTFRGNQLAMATGYASLRIMREQDLAGNAQARGDFIRSELNRLAQEFPCIGNVRGRGLMIGIEIVDERRPADRMGSLPADAVLAAEIQKACFNNKLLLERGGRNGTVVRLLAPLIITQQECEELIKRFRQSVADALESVRG